MHGSNCFQETPECHNWLLIRLHVPFQVTEKKSKPHIQVDIGGGQMKTFAPEEISAMVLTKMKETAEAYLGKKVNKALRGNM